MEADAALVTAPPAIRSIPNPPVALCCAMVPWFWIVQGMLFGGKLLLATPLPVLDMVTNGLITIGLV
ncbi:MAG: hypothetical protein ABSC95_30095 [Acetobacteraceae bacterium]